MGNRHFKWIGLIFILLFFLFGGAIARANEPLTDDSGDVEEVIASSQGAKAAAKITKGHAAKEKQAAFVANQDAKRVRATAEAKQKEAAFSIKQSEDEIKASKAEQATLRKTIERFNLDIAKSEKSLQDQRQKMERVQAETQALKSQRNDRLQRIADLQRQEATLKQESADLDRLLEQARAAHQKSQNSETVVSRRVEKLKSDVDVKQSRANVEVTLIPKAKIVQNRKSAKPKRTIAQSNQSGGKL